MNIAHLEGHILEHLNPMITFARKTKARRPMGWGCLMVMLLAAGWNGALAQDTPDTPATDERVIRALDSEWSKMADAHNLDKIVAFYADDALLLPPNEALAGDKAAIRASWTGALQAFSRISWRVTTIGVAKSGDLAYLTGAWTGTVKGPGGAPIPVTGKLVEVWKKQDDGQWKCIVDTFNSDAHGAAQPASAK